MARGEAAGVGGPSYQPGSIRRQRRTRDQVRQLDAQILEVLRDDHPQSVRIGDLATVNIPASALHIFARDPARAGRQAS